MRKGGKVYSCMGMPQQKMTDIFSQRDFKMPEGFLWGSSTAGHQIEGNNIHAGHWDMEIEKSKTDKDYVPSGMACNNYELYEQDVELIDRLGHQAFRMTIEWSRIEPSENNFDMEAVNHYIKELGLLNEKGIKVLLTLVHFTVPKWFADKGEFTKEENIKYFENYLNFILPKVCKYVSYWNTFNETNHHHWPTDRKLCTLKFHAMAYHLIKKYSDAPVGIAHALKLYFPKRYYNAADKMMVEYYDYITNEYFFHAIRTGEIVFPFTEGELCPDLKGTSDFWSINWYTRDLIDAKLANPIADKYNHNELRLIDKKIYFDEFFAEGMLDVLTRLNDKPVYITENGCCADDDRFRIVYIAQVLSSIRDAIDAGVDVRGYYYWSLMDNYEWGSFIPRFGMVHCDFETFKRTPKPSAYFYKEIIENNGVSQELIRKYLKEIPSIRLGK